MFVAEVIILLILLIFFSIILYGITVVGINAFMFVLTLIYFIILTKYIFYDKITEETHWNTVKIRSLETNTFFSVFAVDLKMPNIFYWFIMVIILIIQPDFEYWLNESYNLLIEVYGLK